ncbi:MAG: hypothetical protein ACLQFR_13750 [Streptosporangiaceae bacterium]
MLALEPDPVGVSCLQVRNEYSGGAHYCLGHLVAREDMAVAQTVLARRLRDLRDAGKPVWQPYSGKPA